MEGGFAAFQVEAVSSRSADLHYAWERRIPEGEWERLEIASSPKLVLLHTSAKDSGHHFRALVTDGINTEASLPANLEVVPPEGGHSLNLTAVLSPESPASQENIAVHVALQTPGPAFWARPAEVFRSGSELTIILYPDWSMAAVMDSLKADVALGELEIGAYMLRVIAKPPPEKGGSGDNLKIPFVVGPELQLIPDEHGLLLAWPATAAHYIPEFTETLAAKPGPVWRRVPGTPTKTGDRCVLPIQLEGKTWFFRLVAPEASPVFQAQVEVYKPFPWN